MFPAGFLAVGALCVQEVRVFPGCFSAFGSIGSSSGFVAADLGVALADGEPKPLLVDFFDPLNDLEQPFAATGTPSSQRITTFYFIITNRSQLFKGRALESAKKKRKIKIEKEQKDGNLCERFYFCKISCDRRAAVVSCEGNKKEGEFEK